MDIITTANTPNPRVDKIIGFDTELMNIDPARNDAGFSASRTLLEKVPGLPANNGVLCEQDAGRKFLPGNGASIYVDLDHLELAGPECRSALDFLKSFHGMLGIAREAARKANEGRDSPLRVHGNNSDSLGHSWGGHLSVSMSRTAYDWIFLQRPHYLQFLASAQASSMIITGAGKVGSENGRAALPYQISQRADYFEVIQSLNTTFARPLVNTRDETLAGSGLARLHCIFHDTTLCHTSLFMKAGLMQIFLAMIEAEEVDVSLCFEEPLLAVHTFSADPSLKAKARLTDGRWVTAPEHQSLLRERAGVLLENGGEAHVPGLKKLLSTWARILEAFREDDRAYLIRHLDWVAKLSVLQHAATTHTLDFSAPSMTALDLAWSDLENGIYFAFERSGAVERLAGEEEIILAANEAPDDTRAYPRSKLIRAFGGKPNVSLDWGEVVVGRRKDKRLVVKLPDPGAGRQSYGDLDNLSGAELLECLGTEVIQTKWSWNYTSPSLSPYQPKKNHE